MVYRNILSAFFLSRPNRFVALTELDGSEVAAHVKNTGRCAELLIPGVEVFLEDFSGRQGKRKLLYDLVTVRKADRLVNMDSQAPCRVVHEALADGTILLPKQGKPVYIRPEYTYGDSRFDFLVRFEDGSEGLIEVKGVTLEEDGTALFPDAPTERGVKHLNGLIRAKEAGYYTCVLFVVQMAGVRCFSPNDKRHAAFGEALRRAAASGVDVLAYECNVTPDSLRISKKVEVVL
ncbi:MAG: DNA/RNA nuclease SfsA [Ruminococcaceae bacterium]|nr:DNA/RNA nuclease SfsA [Oscillospiraceae bacterium]